MKRFITSVALVSVLAIAVSGVVFAQPTSVQTAPSFNTSSDVLAKISTIANWVFTALLIVSVFMILVAAFQFVTGGGNAEQISKARMSIIWAAVGIIIALFARGFPVLLQSLLT